MSISAEEKVCYLREAAIVLAKEGFQLDEVHTDRLCILLDGAPLCEVTESGGIAYRNEDIDEPERIAAKDTVYEIVRTTAEYMRQMEMAPFFISERSSLMPLLFHARHAAAGVGAVDDVSAQSKNQRRWDIPQPISLHAQRCGVRILPELCPQASVPSM